MKEYINKTMVMFREMGSEIIDFYRSLPIQKKVVFIIILVLAKLGPDMLTYGLIIRYIRNKRKKAVAYLLYDEKKKSFLIEIPKDSKLEELPMILRASASRGIFQMDEKNSRRWVQDRIVSPNRQNIGQILRRLSNISAI